MSTRTASPRPGSTPRVPVDPRIRERWVAARRAEGRRRLRVVLLVLGALVLVAAALAVAESPLLDVDRVMVTGTARVTPEEVAAAAGVGPGDAMVWIDGGAAARRVEAMPWVRSARFRREWPGTVVLSVRERTPVAWVGAVAGAALVDRTGRVLAHVDARPSDLPELVGGSARGVAPPGATIADVTGARVAGRLQGLARSGTRAITVARSGVVLTLVDGPELRLGRPDRVMTKIRAALAVLTALAGSPVGYVDVSVPESPVAGPPRA